MAANGGLGDESVWNTDTYHRDTRARGGDIFTDLAEQASLDGTVLKGEDASVARRLFEDLLVERFEEPDIEDRRTFSGLFSQPLRRFQRPVGDGSQGKDGDIFPVCEPLSFPYGEGCAFSVPPVGAFPDAARVPDHQRAVLYPMAGVEEPFELGFVFRRSDHGVRDASQRGQVERSLVSRSVLSHEPGPVEAQNHIQVLQGDIVDDLVVGSLGE